jgi:hypothetical protein
MEASERDRTEDWLLAEEEKPPLFGELVERVDEALRLAQASEQAVASAGEAAIAAASRARDALEQATVAAEHAQRSAEHARESATRAAEGASRAAPERSPLEASRRVEDPSLRKFSDRADRLVARLRALQRIPLTGRDRASAE